jgi:WD40 repeat protein
MPLRAVRAAFELNRLRPLLVGTGRGGNTEAHVWGIENGKPIHTMRPGGGPIRAVSFFPGATRLGPFRVALLVDRRVVVYLGTATKELTSFSTHDTPVTALEAVPGEDHLLTGGEDATVRLWDAGTGKELRRFEGHTGKVLCVAVSPNGRLVASGGEDHTIRVWKLAP